MFQTRTYNGQPGLLTPWTIMFSAWGLWRRLCVRRILDPVSLSPCYQPPVCSVLYLKEGGKGVERTGTQRSGLGLFLALTLTCFVTMGKTLHLPVALSLLLTFVLLIKIVSSLGQGPSHSVFEQLTPQRALHLGSGL